MSFLDRLSGRDLARHLRAASSLAAGDPGDGRRNLLEHLDHRALDVEKIAARFDCPGARGLPEGF
jgi:hypothetical protein